MKKDNFALYSLITFFIIGVATKWILPIRIIVVLNSLLVLFGIAIMLYKTLKRKGN